MEAKQSGQEMKRKPEKSQTSKNEVRKESVGCYLGLREIFWKYEMWEMLSSWKSDILRLHCKETTIEMEGRNFFYIEYHVFMIH